MLRHFTTIKKYLLLFNAFNFNDIDNDAINNSIKIVHQIYIDNGRSDSTAKAKYFTEAVVNDAMSE